MLDFRILGPLEVVTEAGHVRLGGPKQRATLAILLLNANRVVSVDRLADDLYGGAAPVTVIPGVVFVGSSAGTVYAYSTADGKALWQFDTAREFETVNGVPAKGGNMSSAGPVVADGMVFVPSGYSDLGNGVRGNVLLAFGPK